MPYVPNLLRRSQRLFVALVKVMLPVMIAVQIAQQLGWVDALGRAIAPAMALLNLPPEAGMVWVTGAFVGVYGAIAVLMSLASSLDMSAGQFSALCAMILFTHSLPVEQAIVRRAGGGSWATTLLRLGAALVYGGAVAWFCQLTGVLSEPISLEWLHGSAAGADTVDASLVTWIRGTVLSLALTFAIIVGLLVLLDVLERTGATRWITTALTPVLRISGLDARATPVTMVGVLLGLTYGGALIIEESEKEHFTARMRLLALAWVSLSHSLIEDTVLFMALGADIWIVLVGRVLLTLLIVAGLAKLTGGDDRAKTGIGAEAGA